MSAEAKEIARLPHFKMLVDIFIIAIFAVVVYIAAYFMNLPEVLIRALESSGAQQTSAFFIAAIFLTVGFVFFAVRRWNEVTQVSKETGRLQDALERANSKLMFLNNITRYDILNELTQLHRNLEQAEKTPVVRAVDEAIDRIRRQIKFTKEYQDIGAVPPSWQNVADAIMRAKVGVDLGNVSFDMEVHDMEIYADPLLEKVFYYLISNSLKYGGPKLTQIRIYRKKADDKMVILFEDDGVGISQEKKGYLFPKEWGSRKHAGYGLFLIRETLGVTGITIWESGTPGQGARFEIAVPKGVFRQI
ncbi:sensor histidine kinase [Methanoregula formicica]|uniref:Bacteriophytochrome (Light-regulated signal transduction histidine kinase) n=1 Tax=Methanoregula formicica (strain DSM 22288 / NBRC 105244 / SMSP) TaxID=593750 RepID=L0HI27_METFS|nr:HAMP domain-containing sensor histidine kinase [Methanoregula formicica]AGB02714.1 bacteriophytochrome (light-regulated signal transduction histidine kinase) [Methanoregula formicica SMSP]